MKCSVVIPVYNSEASIERVVEEVLAEVSYEVEIVLVNDSSKDKSEKKCKALCGKFNQVKFLNLSKNFGQHNAIMAGLSVVDGDLIVCMDDDLQTPPQEVNKLIDTLIEQDYDVVYGNYGEKKHSVFRNWGSRVNDKMANYMLGKPKEIQITSFFAMRRYIAEEIKNYRYSFPYLGGLIFRTTNKIGKVDVHHESRKEGKSNYNFKKLIGLWFNGFINFSVTPLRLTSLIGTFFSGAGFLYLIVIIIKKLINPGIAMGWTSIMATVIFFGGIQLISIGLIGEYIGRLYLNINEKPQYVIRESWNVKSKNEH